MTQAAQHASRLSVVENAWDESSVTMAVPEIGLSKLPREPESTTMGEESNEAFEDVTSDGDGVFNYLLIALVTLVLLTSRFGKAKST